MQTIEQIENRIKEILAEEVFQRKGITLFTNAVVHLMQLELEVELHTLQKVLGIPLTDIRKFRGERPQTVFKVV